MKIDRPTPADLPVLRALWQDSFGDTDAYLNLFFRVAFSKNRCLCVYAEGQPVAAAYWLDCSAADQKLAYIYAVATAKPYRGRGYCRVLMAAIHDRLAQDGYAGSVLVPVDESLRQMYGSMGYENFGGLKEFSCSAGAETEKLQRIHKTAFARLRRQYLPEKGIVQEGEGLVLLDAIAKFYLGDNCLLAISRDSDPPLVLEYWGTEAKAPGIVSALGASHARFRVAGKEAFAMYHPLNGDFFPEYFAFAFD